MQRVDHWCQANPWHPRVLPLIIYIGLLGPVVWLRDVAAWAFPIAYTLQCALVIAALWRYRKLLPELNLKFHFSAVWIGSLVFVVWMLLGFGMMSWFPRTFGGKPGYDYFTEMGQPLGWLSMSLRLLGMSIVVPLFEELFHRSCTLRSFISFRRTAIGGMNLLQDMPVLDELLRNHELARRAGRHESVFEVEFNRHPIGTISLWAMFASSFIFMLAHGLRDWPACLFCGFAYCWIVWYTNRGNRKLGLGPAVWAHGITNAQIWIYSVICHYAGFADWRFMG